MSSSSATQSAPSRLDTEPVSRRDVLGLAAMWSAMATLAFGILGALRLPRAAVVPAATHKFRVTLPANLAEGEAFLPAGRSVALFRGRDGVYAVSTVCTHLGCVVKSDAAGFECPCHGSRFRLDGTVEKGPAPKALPWLAVTPVEGDTYLVDSGTIVAPGKKAAV